VNLTGKAPSAPLSGPPVRAARERIREPTSFHVFVLAGSLTHFVFMMRYVLPGEPPSGTSVTAPRSAREMRKSTR